MAIIHIIKESWRNSKVVEVYNIDLGKRTLEEYLEHLKFTEEQSSFLNELVHKLVNHFELEINQLKKEK